MDSFQEKMARWRSSDKSRWMPVGLGILFLFAFGYTIYYFWGQAQRAINDTMTEQLNHLVDIFHRIDNQCKILGFDLEKTPINFLNVKNFAGSEVGSMNLAYPHKWQGPYVETNPTVEGKHYYILKTKNAHYIVPGDGVQLKGGKVLGKDVVITSQTDIEALIKREKGLTYDGHPLIVPLALEHKDALLAKLKIEAYGASLAE